MALLKLLILSLGIRISLASLPVPPARYKAGSGRRYSNYTSTTALSDIASETLISTSDFSSLFSSVAEDTTSGQGTISTANFVSTTDPASTISTTVSTSTNIASTTDSVTVGVKSTTGSVSFTAIIGSTSANLLPTPSSPSATDSSSTKIISTTNSPPTTYVTSTIDSTSTGATSTTGHGATTEFSSTVDTISTSHASSTGATSTDPVSTTNSASTTEAISSTDFPSFTIPTETIISGPAETSQSVAIVPVFLYLWSERLILQDEKLKRQYIEDVKKTQRNTHVLFDHLKDKPPARPECKRTSLRKRSLVSGILNAFKEVADLISCAADVLDNLADAVDKIHPPIPEIDLLTDTLKDLGNEIKKRGDEEHPTSASASELSSTSSSSSSSCTTSITKTWESVLCTVTAAPSGNEKQINQVCTTEVFSTVTGCSAVASTVTSTATIAPEPSGGLCGFGLCGPGETCPQEKRGLEKRAPPRLSHPPPNTWYGPENYGGSAQDFIAGEAREGYKNGDQTMYRGVKLDEGTTSGLLGFSGQVGTLAVAGLFGCTSVIAVSRRGAWITHHWEVPSFTHLNGEPSPPTSLEQLEIFRREVLQPLRSSTSQDHDYGLSELRVTDPNDKGILSHLMADEADPHVFIFAPYKRALSGTSNWNNEFPIGLPEAFGQDDGLPSKNQQIENEIRAIFSIPNGLAVPYEKVLYAPRQGLGLENDDLGDANFNSHRGKVLVQYQPAKSCHDKAAWRVWFEGQCFIDNSTTNVYRPRNFVADSTADFLYRSRQFIVYRSTIGSLYTARRFIITSYATNFYRPRQFILANNVTNLFYPPRSLAIYNTTDFLYGPRSLLFNNDISFIYSTSSSTAISSSSTRQGTSSLLSSSTSQSTSLPNQSTKTPSLTSRHPSSVTSLSSTEASTESSTTTPDSTTKSPTSTVTTESPTDTTSAESTPTPTVTITPLQVIGIVCNNEADFPGHADVSPGYQKKYAQFFGDYAQPESGDMYSSTPPLDGKFRDPHGISYEYVVSWIPGCVTTVDRQSVQFPLGDGQKNVKARDLLVNDFKHCNNGGVGGSTQVGCLKYAFIGAK
ncbi:hypothetical protein EKO27_g10559 [Xylaria grammica]|uniref:Uncharacterized protein n=1 Tax=Xylaria grammica TaxID=363999 RepID=A0A439CQX6_9PEZI|nr:hypothetical protein EKO27_g10559 [Xylaria grammica]